MHGNDRIQSPFICNIRVKIAFCSLISPSPRCLSAFTWIRRHETNTA